MHCPPDHRLELTRIVVRQGSQVIPVEVEAGRAGSMKSLHAFMHGKGLALAARLDGNPTSDQDLAVKATTGEEVRFRLLSLPL